MLLLVNLVFYAWGEPVYILIMFLSIGIDYTHGMLVEKYKRRGNDRGARWAVASSVIFNLALLFFFKYWDFVAGSLQAIGFSFMPKLGLSLPIGISFYTFQTMSYTIDVYRDDAKVQRSLVNFGTFVTLFPQLIAGPIIKYKDLGDQIDHRTHSPEQFASGVQIFVVGLAKKVLLANNIGKLWDTILALPAGELTTAGAWLGVAAFAFQLYFDFSGYSDMAVGLGRMLGFEFMRNFNYPYIAKSVTEFWRRWHISLGTWFREYLYIPLGGNRVSKPRPGFSSLLVVWVGHRHLARGELELPHLGTLLRRPADFGKGFPGQAPPETSRRPPAPIHPVSGTGELGHLRRGGLRPYGSLPQGHVRPGRRPDKRQRIVLFFSLFSPCLSSPLWPPPRWPPSCGSACPKSPGWRSSPFCCWQGWSSPPPTWWTPPTTPSSTSDSDSGGKP